MYMPYTKVLYSSIAVFSNLEEYRRRGKGKIEMHLLIKLSLKIWEQIKAFTHLSDSRHFLQFYIFFLERNEKWQYSGSSRIPLDFPFTNACKLLGVSGVIVLLWISLGISLGIQ